MKNQCYKIQKRLSCYMDGQLPPKQMQKVKEHLQSCPTCKQEYEALLTIKEQISNIPEQPLPSNFQQSLHLRLVEESQKQPGKQNNWMGSLKPYSAVAAGLLLTLLVGTGYYQQFKPVEQELTQNAYVNDIQLEDSEASEETASSTPQPSNEAGIELNDTAPSSAPAVPNSNQQGGSSYQQSNPQVKEDRSSSSAASSSQTQQPENQAAQQQSAEAKEDSAPSGEKATESPAVQAEQQEQSNPPQAPMVASSFDAPESYGSNEALSSDLETSAPSGGSGGGASSSGSKQGAPIFKQYTFNLKGNQEFLAYLQQNYELSEEDGTLVIYADNQQLNEIVVQAGNFDVSVQFDFQSDELSSNKCVIIE
jgi:anti-sigma factor RsiW